MSLNIFGLTHTSVRAHFFPASDAWSANSNPSSTTVGEIIDEEGGRLAGALNAEDIDASTITDTTSPAYLQCRDVLRKMVALRLARIKTGLDPDVVKAWKAEVDAWLQELSEGGATFLGGGATTSGSSDPDGPTSHISEYALETLAGEDMSDLSSERLKRSDRL